MEEGGVWKLKSGKFAQLIKNQQNILLLNLSPELTLIGKLCAKCGNLLNEA